MQDPTQRAGEQPPATAPAALIRKLICQYKPWMRCHQWQGTGKALNSISVQLFRSANEVKVGIRGSERENCKCGVEAELTKAQPELEIGVGSGVPGQHGVWAWLPSCMQSVELEGRRQQLL